MHKLQLMQEYICLTCGSGGSVVYGPKATASEIIALIKADHKEWCPSCVSPILEFFFQKKNALQGPLRRQNYSCNICGLKSFVTYSSKENEFDVSTKIRNDHEKREPTCPCPLDDLNIVGEPTEV